MSGKKVRIGCGGGFWGDTAEGPLQLIRSGAIDYLVMDYLAEITMSILARMREVDAARGYATDFVTQLIVPHAKELARTGIKVVVNAGGVNPRSCMEVIAQELQKQGVPLKVAAVVGDDLGPMLDEIRGDGIEEMSSGAALPARVISANAYFGAFPIARALAAGADIVVTGRCADSALALGPLIHEFGWRPDQYDLLAAGSLAGHVIECGAQATGGFFTDWKDVADGWANIGFPIAECEADGSFVVTKPEDTGGLVSYAVVAEQISYETGDPRRYVLPDVVCDLSRVRVEEVGPNRVHVSGARGFPPTPTYKVSATYADGYRSLATLLIKGFEAAPKARAVAAAILQRTRNILHREGLRDYSETSVEVLGAEDTYGPHARHDPPREVVVKIAARHDRREALEIFSREIFPTATSTVQGLAGIFGGRPKVQPVVRLFSFLIDKVRVPATVLTGDGEERVPPHLPAARAGDDVSGEARADEARADEASMRIDASEPAAEVPLIALAWARSGDKGDISNIAVMARRPEFVPVLRAQLTAQRVREYMAHLADGEAQRFEWPGLNGFNFLLHQALGGGGVASLRYDPQGKGYAQTLLEFPVRIPRHWIDKGLVQTA
ncbi:MAG: acyclic terpene utilization AtuA family protein [Burkholderiaceae bacterium]